MVKHRLRQQGSRRAAARLAIGLASLGVGSMSLSGAAWAVEAPPSAPQPGPTDAPPCSAAAKACVRLSTHQAWLTMPGQPVYGPITMNDGAHGYETPTGKFTVQWKDKDHRSSEFNNAAMPYSVFFDGNGRAFHAGDIDKQSAGCVRLPTDAARKFFDALQPGDVVEIVP